MKKTCIIAVIFIAVNSFAQVTGQIRVNLVSSAKQSCFQNQRVIAPVNIPDRAIKQYCNCAANHMADSLNNNQVAAIESGKMQIPPNMIAIGAEYCKVNINKYSRD